MDELLQIYEQAELSILRILAKNISLWAQGKAVDIKQQRKDIIAIILQLKDADEQAKDSIIRTYLGNGGTNAFIQSDRSTIFTLVDAYRNNSKNARRQVLRQAEDIYRRIIYHVTTQSALGIDTRLQTAQKALVKFAGQGITGFVDRAGRQWDIRSYTEMATRTTLAQAQRQGRIDKLVADGDDLIIISKVPNPSDTCKPWERRILSVSGTSTKYPSLDEAKSQGLFHPGCRHSFTKYVPGLTTTEAPDETDNYEQTQEQRALERRIRKQKRILEIDPNNQRAKDTIRTAQSELRTLTQEYDLNRKRNREGNISAR